jgi:hypothetical protein
MTVDQINAVIAATFAGGKRSISQLRKSVRLDVPEAAASGTRLATLCERFLQSQALQFNGTVDGIGASRFKFTGSVDPVRELQAVTYGKTLDVEAGLAAAMAACRKAWTNGKDEPKAARRTVLNAVYFPAAEGGISQHHSMRAACEAFVAECKARNEATEAATAAVKAAEENRRNAEAAAVNAKGIAKANANNAAAKAVAAAAEVKAGNGSVMKVKSAVKEALMQAIETAK